MPEPAAVREIPTAQASTVDALVSEAFGYRGSHRFFQDFPVWASDQVQRWGYFKDSELVSHAGLRVASMGERRIGLVGAVATVASERGQGLSTQLLQHLIDRASAQDLDWLVLWGSEHKFYGKLGFRLVGDQVRVPLEALFSDPTPEWVTVQEGYTPRIFAEVLRQSQASTTLALTPADQSWFERHETVRWFWTAQPFAFAGLGRGMDLSHLVHECGGEPHALENVFRFIAQQDPAAQWLTHPTQLASWAMSAQASAIHEKLCLALSLRDDDRWPDHFWISGLNAC